jgi:uncharacterized protein with PIN domain
MQERNVMEQHAAMTWSQRLKRVFKIDMAVCERCNGPVKVIATIEEPVVTGKILDHLQFKAATTQTSGCPPPVRAPPVGQYWQGQEG